MGIHAKPCGFLDANGYGTPLVTMIDHMVAEGFLSPAFAAMIAVETAPDALLARFDAYQPPPKGGPLQEVR